MLPTKVDDLFTLWLYVGWIFSAALLIAAFCKYKTLTFFDASTILSWFFIFFRPLHITSCEVNINLYYWNESQYIQGSIISIIALITLQAASLLVSKKLLPPALPFKSELFEKRIALASMWAFLSCLAVVALMFSIFGSQVFPANRGQGAISVSLPGLEFFYHTIRALTLISIILSGLLFLIFKQKKQLFIAFFSLLILLIFAKRNAIIYPILYTLFLFGIHQTHISHTKFLKVAQKTIPPLLFIIFIAFFGKAFKSQEPVSLNVPTDGYACEAIRLGMQEFDLFWPAVLETSKGEVNLIDLPYAIWGALAYGHQARLKSSYLSITDKTMLLYNYQNYVNNKYGISPSIAQFYFYYLSFFSFPVFALIGYFLRRLDFSLAQNIFSTNFGKFFLTLSASKLLASPFDFTIKYSAFEAAIFLALYVILIFVFSIRRALLAR